MFNSSKHRWIVSFTTALLLLLAATGAISRRMRTAADQALAAPASNCVDWATAPLAQHFNSALTNVRESSSVTLMARRLATVTNTDMAPGLALPADSWTFPEAEKVPSACRSLQARSVRWQV